LDSTGYPLWDGDTAEFVKSKGFIPTFQHKGIQESTLSDTNPSPYDKTLTSHYTLGVKDPKIFPRCTFVTETVSRSCQNS
jgi:hypothetical protein